MHPSKKGNTGSIKTSKFLQCVKILKQIRSALNPKQARYEEIHTQIPPSETDKKEDKKAQNS